MPPDARPVFIGGLDQSGKTPLRRILDASSTVAFSRRLYLWTTIYGRYGDLEDDANLAHCMRDLERHPGIREHGIDLASVEVALRRGPRDYAALVALIGEQMARAAGRDRWGMQEGGTEARAGQVFETFPHARLLHMVRDPRDRHLAIAADRRRPGLLGVSLATWRRNAHRARTNRRRYGDRYLVIRFEDLVAAPVEIARRVGQFIDEPDVGALERAAAEWAERQRRSSSSGDDPERQWRTMRREELLLADRIVGPELQAFGYRRHAPRLSPAERIRYVVADLPLNGASAMLSAAREFVGTANAGKFIRDEVAR